MNHFLSNIKEFKRLLSMMKFILYIDLILYLILRSLILFIVNLLLNYEFKLILLLKITNVSDFKSSFINFNQINAKYNFILLFFNKSREILINYLKFFI
jgi:hypothetical protein